LIILQQRWGWLWIVIVLIDVHSITPSSGEAGDQSQARRVLVIPHLPHPSIATLSRPDPQEPPLPLQPPPAVTLPPLRGTLFFILLMQTAHIINGGDSRYINLRHILMKWVLLVGVVVLADVVDDGSNLYQFFSMFCHLFALIAVYPSKVGVRLCSSLRACI
jgi:hypothetical protein